MKDRPIPELLAPAGGFPQLRAAVQNGADAVYMGGTMFNARMRADNFGDEELAAAVEYAHLRNVRLYVTLNTLIGDDELFKAFSYACGLWEMGVDGLIIQDLGLGRLLRRYLPEMPLHLSTQATVYGPAAVPQVKALGCSRVVPARELTLEEIREFAGACHAGDDPIEVEVFCHGALCMCYSGQCQLSRAIGGGHKTGGGAGVRSGNRGMCAQPCRLPYTDDAGRRGYFLSPKDLCTIDHIQELCEAGVDSLKIEGRLKSAEYVAVVTSIYRKYLDQYRERGAVSVEESDRRDLEQIFSRGGFTSGYLFGNPGEDILSGSTPKNRGIYAGEVTKGNGDGCLVDVRLAPGETIAMGDGIEIRRGVAAGDAAGNVVTYIRELGEGKVRIGDLRKPVFPGDGVFRVTSSELMARARESFASDDRRKVPVSMSFYGFAGRKPQLRMECGGTRVTAEGSSELEMALKRPSDEETVRTQLSKLGGTVYEAAEISVRMDEGIMIPKSMLNGLRREAAAMLDEARRGERRPGVDPGTFEEVKRDLKRAASEAFRSPGDWPVSESGARMPALPAITKGETDRRLSEDFDGYVSALGPDVVVENLGWIDRLREAGVRMHSGPGLNIYNKEACLAVRELGVEPAMWSWETEDAGSCEMPLMITEHPVRSSCLIDRKGVRYDVTPSEAGDKFVIRRSLQGRAGRGSGDV